MIVIVTQTARCTQLVGDIDGHLTEARHAEDAFIEREIREIARMQQRATRHREHAIGAFMDGDAVQIGQIFMVQIDARDILQELLAGGDAQFLAEGAAIERLLTMRDIERQTIGRQIADMILEAVIGGDRGQRVVPGQRIVHLDRSAPDIGAVIANTRRIFIHLPVRTIEIAEGMARRSRSREEARRCNAANAGWIDLIRCAAFLIDLGIEADEVDRKIVTRRPGQTGTAAILIGAVDIAVGEDVVLVAIARRRPQREAAGEIFRNAAADITGNPAIAVIAERDIDHRFRRIRRLAGVDVHRADRRVAAVKRALRPAQHFNGADVEQVLLNGTRGGDIHAIDEDADIGLNTRIGARSTDTANLHHRVTVVVGLQDVQAGDEMRQLRHAADAAVFKLIAGEGGNRHRDFLHVLGAFFRRDDHGFDAAAAGHPRCGLLSAGRPERQCRQKRRGRCPRGQMRKAGSAPHIIEKS